LTMAGADGLPTCQSHADCPGCRRCRSAIEARLERLRLVARAARLYARRRTSTNPDVSRAAWLDLVRALDATRRNDL